MPVHFIHAPYMKESRDKLLELQQAGADIVYVERWTSADDARYNFAETPHISFLPTLLLVDDDHKTELCRAEKLEHINKAHVDWMHQQHQQWKHNGKKDKFPTPPWKKEG
jgi:2-methylisocitrate lyase-like PEP mutase family enzyme